MKKNSSDPRGSKNLDVITSAKAKAILALYDQMKKRLPDIVPTQFTIQTIDAIFDRPIFKTTDFIERSNIPKQSAMRILKALQDHGTLVPIREGRGNKAAILLFHELISLTEGSKKRRNGKKKA